MILDKAKLQELDAMHRATQMYRNAACSLLRQADQIDGDAHRCLVMAAGYTAKSRLVVNYETGEVVEAEP